MYVPSSLLATGRGSQIISHADPLRFMAELVKRSPRLPGGRPDSLYGLGRDYQIADLHRALAEADRHIKRAPSRGPHPKQTPARAIDSRQERIAEVRRELAAHIDSRYHVALHEAAHCAVVVRKNIAGLGPASIVPNDSSLGRVFVFGVESAPLPIALLFYQSGYAAEAHHAGKPRSVVMTGDDHARAHQLMTHITDRTKRIEIVNAAREEAIKFVADNWPAIVAVANELCVKDTLRRDEIIALVKSN